MSKEEELKEMFEIRIEEKPLEILKTIMFNNEELNNGNEIGAWLLGKWSEEKDKAIATIKEIHIPKQEVQSAEVDISPDSMINTVKELGPKKCREIIGHWHIHPFSKGRTDWSGIDESKIKDWMDPTKQREVFLFLLSSLDWMKGRIEINIQNKFKEMEFTTRYTLDDMEINTISKQNKELFEQVKKEIALKVREKKQTWKTTFTGTTKGYKDTLFDVTIKKKKKQIEIIVKKGLAEYITLNQYVTDEIANPDERKENRKTETWTWQLKKGDNIKQVAKMLAEEMSTLEDEFIMETEKTDYEKEYDLQKKAMSEMYGIRSIDREMREWYGL